MPYWQDPNFNLDNMQDDECISEFRGIFEETICYYGLNLLKLQIYWNLCSAQTIFLSLSLFGYGSSIWYGYSSTEYGM